MNDPGPGKPRPPATPSPVPAAPRAAEAPRPAPRPAGTAVPPAAPPQVAPARPAAPAPPAVAPVRPPVAARPAAPAVPKVAPVVPAIAPAGRPAAGRAPAGPGPSASTVPPSGGPSVGVDDLEDLLGRTSRLNELDYYEVLKVERTAAPADIKRAFYRESRSYHPDRFFQLADPVLKERVHELYKRVTEAYSVLRDEVKRKRYTQDISGPERAQKLRFTELSEVEVKQAVKREQEEQIGVHPKGRQFFKAGLLDLEAQRWDAAERNLKMALTYEPQNARYKERLQEAQGKLAELAKDKGEGFKIK